MLIGEVMRRLRRRSSRDGAGKGLSRMACSIAQSLRYEGYDISDKEALDSIEGVFKLAERTRLVSLIADRIVKLSSK